MPGVKAGKPTAPIPSSIILFLPRKQTSADLPQNFPSRNSLTRRGRHRAKSLSWKSVPRHFLLVKKALFSLVCSFISLLHSQHERIHFAPRRRISQAGQDLTVPISTLPSTAAPTWRRFGQLFPIWEEAPNFTPQDTEVLARGFLRETRNGTALQQKGDVDFAYANDLGRYRASVVKQRLGL